MRGTLLLSQEQRDEPNQGDQSQYEQDPPHLLLDRIPRQSHLAANVVDEGCEGRPECCREAGYG